ncbi:MAG: MmgE/PrpD family protein [Betaproteobacteria bacterium]|nr:MmgE/PrpD family protein [Betaproteobacteria bacterium]
MDETTERIADHVAGLRFDDLPDETVHQCRRIVVDTIGCALGAIDAEPVKIAREIAMRASAPPGARIIGTQHRALPELAAFANGVMARYLDANDAYPGGGGHPSDMISALLAAAEPRGANGQAIVTALVAAYDVYHALWKATSLRDKGMDNVFYTTVAGAAGAARILGLDRKGMGEAISLAAIPNVALDATRYGDLSMWKGCAGGNGARNGVFAALLASTGMTGPAKPFAGDHGLESLAGRFTLKPFPDRGGRYRIMEATLKCFASEGHSLSPITAALSLSKQIRAEDIQQVTVYTYRFAWDVIGREPEKWRPTTRESADHSMPYVVANALIEGGFTDAAFAPERLMDPKIHALMDKIAVKEDPDLTRQFPNRLPCRIEIVSRTGERKVATTDYPRGHCRNPMSDEEIEVKFRSHASRALDGQGVEKALAALWTIDSAQNLDPIFTALAR